MRLFYLILIFFSLGASAQRPFSRDFRLTESQTAISVNAMTVCASGYVWVGSSEGLFRFNGRDFKKLEDSSKTAVSALASSGGDIYIGYENGKLAVIKSNEVHALKSVNQGPRSPIHHILVGGAGTLWLSTEEGVFLYCQGIYSLINSNKGLADDYCYQVAPRGKSLLIGTDNGLSEMEITDTGLGFSRLGMQDGLPDNIITAIGVPMRGAYLWTGSQQGGVCRIRRGKTATEIIKYNGTWAWGQVNDLCSISDRVAWAVTETGYLLKINVDDTMSVQPWHFAGKKINKIASVRSGNVWLATNEGLTVVTISHASYIIAEAPYFFSTLTALAAGKGNMLWLGQQKELIALRTGDDTSAPERLAELPANITCMYTHGRNGLWIGTFGRGLWFYSPKRGLEEVNHVKELRNGHILSITAFRSALWVASLNGVDELDVVGEKMVVKKHHDKHSGLGSDYVYQLYNDKKGRLWFATDGAGVSMYDGKQFHNWDSTTGLTAKVVYSVTMDANGIIWAGTPDKGVFKFDGKRWQQLGTDNGLQDMNVSSVIANKTGQVLVVTQDGIDEWFPRSGLFRRFNKKTNLDISQISNTLNCVAADSSGSVFIPFDKGFVVFTNVEMPVDLKPGININEVKLFFQSIEKDRHHFKHNDNQISFRYEGINYTNIDRLHYRYILENYNKDWVYTSDEEVTFAQLPPGEYKFRIQASLDKRFTEVNEAGYSFTISAPVWRSPWFLVLAVSILFSVLYLYIRLRERSLRKVNRLQAERMRFEYEHLKSQVNPHFLFNSLNTLSSLIEEDQRKAVDYTGQLSDLYRSMLAHKDMDLISLEDELQIISSYMYVQKSRFGEALGMEILIPEETRKKKKIIPLALQILVENAIKHNIVSRFMPLVITIEASEDRIIVRNPLHPKISKEKGEGLGLTNIRRRYALLTREHIHYGISNEEFIVSLPLL